jgi:hypothetical protein
MPMELLQGTEGVYADVIEFGLLGNEKILIEVVNINRRCK